MKNSTLFILLAILLCVTACKKDDGPDNPYGLPDATKTGENTFGCLINGEPWIADASEYLGLLPDISGIYDEIGVGVSDRFYFNITARYFVSDIDSSSQDYLGIYVRPIYNEGIIDFSNLNRKDVVFYTSLFNIPNSIQVYELDTLFNDNHYTITTLDTINNIASGEFSFRLIKNFELLKDTLYISEGRFDVKYQPD